MDFARKSQAKTTLFYLIIALVVILVISAAVFAIIRKLGVP